MAKKYSRFLLGLFVTFGLLLGLVLVIWLGAARYFEKGDLYSAYFDESVQGLQADSSVKYRGVEVGRVVSIGVAPDHRLVEVIMKLRLKLEEKEKIVAQLKTAGITGIVFIELDRLEGGEKVTGRALTFEPPYPVIVTRPSDIKQIMQGVAEIYNKIRAVDFEGVTEEFKQAARGINAFFGNEKLARTIEHLENTTRSLDETMKKIDAIMAQGKVNDILEETDKTLAEAKSLIKTVQREIEALNIAQKGAKADRILENFDREGRRLGVQMETLIKSLEQTTKQMRLLLERMEDSPSFLLFGTPTEKER
ncbi:MAG TPA: MlaD family protein [Syntrophales bacterium]|nr:MlaD family protein [Syntrophales bacterium]HOL58797.1 MlaD family protein [Syntrophales bacterium]HPO35124.1 MlaD family protein [Syntrophales bacterium]